MNEYNKNYIIATNLSREQIELFRNIRDSNYKKIQVWSQIDPSSEDRSNLFTANTHYKIENDFSNNVSFPVKMTKIENF
ncbi:MAG: hypothetical protein LBF15_05945 [Candidatus Peribacteria bacterium]|nr:hypothetical protein [Candidatus Peribacteria bacterium]